MQRVRQTILKELKRQKKSRYWLAKQTGIALPNVYQYLNGKSDMSTARIERLLAAMGLEIRRADAKPDAKTS